MSAGQAQHGRSRPEPAMLRPSDAVAALIQLPDGRYVLQLRDAKPEIFYPDHWGCFGGAIEPGEAPAAALAREIQEELGLAVAEAQFDRFTAFTHDFGFAGLGKIVRVYFHVFLQGLEGVRLGEGARVEAFTASQALGTLRMVPYDAFALWMHHSRDRIGWAPD